ncbi:MAG: hypothetical protein AB1656_17920 [Candidatus Omnitrophota bacterium]
MNPSASSAEVKDRLRCLVDRLPDAELPIALRFMEFLLLQPTEIPEIDDESDVQLALEALSDPVRIPFRDILQDERSL